MTFAFSILNYFSTTLNKQKTYHISDYVKSNRNPSLVENEIINQNMQYHLSCEELHQITLDSDMVKESALRAIAVNTDEFNGCSQLERSIVNYACKIKYYNSKKIVLEHLYLKYPN